MTLFMNHLIALNLGDTSIIGLAILFIVRIICQSSALLYAILFACAFTRFVTFFFVASLSNEFQLTMLIGNVSFSLQIISGYLL